MKKSGCKHGRVKSGARKGMCRLSGLGRRPARRRSRR